MITFVYRTDEHVKHKPPASRTDDYFETCVDKLEQIGRIAEDVDADAVLDGGDFFDVKVARENPHWMVRRIMALHKDYPCPVYENPGNHDFPYASVEYVRNQPLGVLFESGVFRRLDDIVFEDGEISVRVVGVPYERDLEVGDLSFEREDEDFQLVVAHCYASMEGGSIYDGSEYALPYPELAELEADGFMFGHWHVEQGVQYVGDKWFANPGSMTRGSLVRDNLQRTPNVLVVRIWKEGDTVVSDVERVDLDVAPADEIFDLEAREQREREKKDMEDFLGKLSATADETEEEDLDGFLDDFGDFEETIRDRAREYLGRVRSGGES